ncbi:hypothetical protein, partial [Vibrio fluvialis]|uniref:hypothetical protein n=1 Tax=Vibrio fluvialis TaxID=676 RepID=UPI00301D8C25
MRRLLKLSFACFALTTYIRSIRWGACPFNSILTRVDRYQYDAASRLTYTENGDAWVSFAYSPSGLLLEENLN